MRRALFPLLAALVLALSAPTAASALRSTPCPHQRGFRCATVRVPLDRSGAVPGSIGLKVAVQPGRKPVLVALSGGPGQSSVRYAGSFAQSLRPALRRYRIAVLDQRGTGGSGALRCPALQRLSELDPFSPAAIGACGERLGTKRGFYGTVESVQDIDALRAALGVRKIAVMGVSYGTFVAVQYARIHPDHTDRLILDSSIGPDGVDPFLLDTFTRLPRILREQCAGGRCMGVTDDPVADVAAALNAADADRLSGPVVSAGGTRKTVRIRSADELTSILLSADLNPALQALLPGAMRAAKDGDPAALVRLRRLAAGPPTSTGELSVGLNVTTGCADSVLPYPLSDGFAARETATAAALAALTPDRYAPFPISVVRNISYAEDCLRWPGTPTPTAPSSAPLPDVPVLLLNGRLDMRTPLENAQALATAFPHSSLVAVPGTGHDELDSDATGCAARALDRFIRNRSVGDPCRSVTNAEAVDARPPHGLSSIPAQNGMTGARGRVVAAAIGAVLDAREMALATLYAGFYPYSGGGLRGGTFTGNFIRSGLRILLTGAQYVHGVRVTGSILAASGGVRGSLRVDGPAHMDGVLVLDGRGGVRGSLGGRTVLAGGASARSAASLLSRTNALPSVASARRVRRRG